MEMLQGWKAVCVQACVSTLWIETCQDLRGLSWDRSCCHSPAGTAAPGNSDFVSGCALPLDSAELTPGWLCGTNPALLTGEKSLSMPMGLCWATHHRVWATLAFTRGSQWFIWNTAGTTVDVLWALWYRLGSRKKREKTGDNYSDLPEGGNWKQIATKSHGYG